MQIPAVPVQPPYPEPAEPFVVVFNRRALAARALRKSGLEEALGDRGLPHEVQDTSSAEESYAVAQAAARAGRVVIAAGGDGTVKDVLNGIMAAGRPDAIMGHIPLGTGNDIARSLGRVGEGFERALDALQEMKVQRIDVGRVGDGEYFINAIGVGFDGEVARRAARMGLPTYFPAVVRTIMGYDAQSYRIAWPGGEWEGRALMVTGMNGSYEGGGFRLAPQARLQDGLLDVYWIDPISLRQFARYVWAVRRGTHERLPMVHMWRLPRLSVECEGALQYHVDGEYRERPPGSRLEIELEPQRLRVIT
jgi:YegS/Rv2252/BmrU family lipid kinase